MRHKWSVISPHVDEPGIPPEHARKQVRCRYCGQRRLVFIGLGLDQIWGDDCIRGPRRLWRRLFPLFGLLVALMLSACNTAPQAGDVVDKDHREGYYSYTPGCSNAKGIATCQIPVWNPERWRIRLCAEDACGWARVSESEYGQIEVGDFYDRRSGADA